LVCFAASALPLSGFALMQGNPESGMLGARNLTEAPESVQAAPQTPIAGASVVSG
jgi:hypothetical protein